MQYINVAYLSDNCPFGPSGAGRFFQFIFGTQKKVSSTGLYISWRTSLSVMQTDDTSASSTETFRLAIPAVTRRSHSVQHRLSTSVSICLHLPQAHHQVPVILGTASAGASGASIALAEPPSPFHVAPLLYIQVRNGILDRQTQNRAGPP